MSSLAPRHVGSSGIRDGTGVPCIAKWLLNHETTREAPYNHLFSWLFVSAHAWPSLRRACVERS